ncbi:MAG: hypothetical protein ACXVAU_07175, partial [Mucilaginibacter sp.]
AILLLLMPFLGFSQINLEQQRFLNNRVELLVPIGFIHMSAGDRDIKYPNQSQQPDVILTDQNGDVNILIVMLSQTIHPSQIAAYKDFQIATLKKSHPNSQWLDNGVRTINGKSVGYFKFITDAADQKIFDYYFFTELDGRVLLLTFNCTEKLLPKWKATAETIVSSLSIK